MHILSRLKRVLSPHNTVFQAFLRRMRIKGLSISFKSENKRTRHTNIENIKMNKDRYEVILHQFEAIEFSVFLWQDSSL